MKLGRMPTTTEVANAMGVEKERIDEILSEDATVFSIHEMKQTKKVIEINTWEKIQ